MIDTLIIVNVIGILLVLIGMGAILCGIRFILNKLAELEICTNIYEAQFQKFCRENGFNYHKVSNNEIVHAFDIWIKEKEDADN